jgi:molybdopterin synthase sulfur carrier subunit
MENLNQITVLCFGKAREITQTKSFSLAIPVECTVGELRLMLCELYPALNNDLAYAIALNQQYAQNETMIAANAEVAVIPPVSGG